MSLFNKYKILECFILKRFGTFQLVFISLVILRTCNSLILFAQDCKSILTIKTNEPYSLIYVDNKITGMCTVKIEVSKGKHYVFIKENKFNWNTEKIIDSINIEECKDRELIYHFVKKYFVSGKPQDTELYVKDSLLGYTPISLSSSISEIKLRHKGYKEKVFSLNNYTAGENFNLLNISKPDNKDFLKTNFFKILVGTAVIFGGTAAYFKLKADDNFDKYNISNNQSYLEKTHKYDLISGIAFGALQINFAALIYFFLTD